MEYLWLFYLLSILDSIRGVFSDVMFIGFIISLVFGIILLVIYIDDDLRVSDETKRKLNKSWKNWSICFPIIFIFCLSLKAILPSQKDAMFIVGAVSVIEASKTETARKLTSKSVEVVEKWLSEKLEPKGDKK